ncbi:MAG TPA: nitroreductase family protein [Pseudomonadales bacterium]|nr:nitroreductase family protein [Pseudomonadales bacterium]
MKLGLDADTLLATTRSVRKRLDLDREVDPEVITECLELALQAPSGSNSQRWHFVFVRDADKRAQIAAWYKANFDAYAKGPQSAGGLHADDPQMAATQARVLSSADYLAQNLHRVPLFLIPCIEGRLDAMAGSQAGAWGSILPAVWSFMLAGRERGLGTCWTTLHLPHERETAALLGIPYESVTQAALIPIAYTIGTDFKTGPRKPMDGVVHHDGW